MFVRTESFRSFVRLYPVVTILTAVNLILAFLTFIYPPLLQKGAGINFLIGQGEYWRLVTPIFFHAGLGHVLFNSFSLVLFGPALEQILGKGKFILAYVGTGIIANIATYFLEPAFYNHVGSSGAIFGLFGIYLYMVLYRKDLIDSANSQIVMTILVIGLLMTFARGNINIAAHLFGLIGGAAISPMLLSGVRSRWHYSGAASSGGISFDPNRWKRKMRRNWDAKKIIWVVLGILVLIGLLSRL